MTIIKSLRKNIKQRKKYDENDKKVLIEQARNKYRELSEKEKDKKKIWKKQISQHV